MKFSLFSNDPRFKEYVYLGLKGRMIHMPSFSSTTKRTFVLVYGQHATLERLIPVAQALQQFGDVYMVDTPGFGGMEPSYRIGQKPSLEFMAGHLEHFVANHVPKDRKITFLGISYGFQVVTAALAAYPELDMQVEHAISFAGFVSGADFNMPLSYTIFLKYCMALPGKTWLGSKLLWLFVRPTVLSIAYFIARPFNVKYKSLAPGEAKQYLREQTWLWIINDHRTHASTAWDFWENVDLTHLRIPVKGVHVGVPSDHLLRNSLVCKELAKIYDDLQIFDLNLANHAPLDLDQPEKVTALLPDSLKQLLNNSHNSAAVIE